VSGPSCVGSGEGAVGGGVVYIGDDAGIVEVEEFGAISVEMDYVAGGSVGWESEEFGDQVAGEEDGVAAAGLVSGYAQQGAGGGEKGFDCLRSDGGMIYEGEKDAFGVGGDGSQAALHGGGLAEEIVFVESEVDRLKSVATPDFVCERAEYDDYRGTVCAEQIHQGVQKSVAAVLQEGLGGTHAARFTGGEYQARGAHFGSVAR
jgi:hypothetical protein